ncbi:MAG: carboxylesterase family protein [Bacteroidota bacterium]|nr:carboxylesterase family protein [Bacteroidota bacterium]
MKELLFILSLSVSFVINGQTPVNDTCVNNRFNPNLTTFAFANTTTTQIVYGVSTTTNVARVYSPQGDLNTCRPLILWAHGGGFTGGSYLEQKTTDMMQQLARKGYVAVAMRYRLSSPTTSTTLQYQEAMIKGVQDMIAAIRFIRANANAFGIDTSQIFIGGSSAGAIIANHTAFMDLSEAFATALANQGGSYNVTTLPTNTNVPYNVAGCVTQAGAIWDLTFLNNETTPWGAVHNTTDPTVAYNTGGGSQQIFTQLQSQNVKSFLKTTYSPGLHTPFPATPTAPYVDTFNLASYNQLYAMLKHQGSASVTVNSNTLTAIPAGQNYQWYLNNTAIPSATNVVYTATVSGNYFVQVKNCATCFSSSQSVSVTIVTTGIKKMDLQNQILVYPSPCKDKIEFKNVKNIKSIEIVSICGKRIYSNTNINDNYTVNTSLWEEGLYFAEIINEDNSRVIVKFFKMN